MHVGAGRNGLTTAPYLARAGLITLALERRDDVGGCVVTEEIEPNLTPGRNAASRSYDNLLYAYHIFEHLFNVPLVEQV